LLRASGGGGGAIATPGDSDLAANQVVPIPGEGLPVTEAYYSIILLAGILYPLLYEVIQIS